MEWKDEAVIEKIYLIYLKTGEGIVDEIQLSIIEEMIPFIHSIKAIT